MAYGTIKVDTITFTDGGVDKSVAISGLVQNPTFTGNVTVTGTISGDILRGQTISGVTITGTTAQFTSGTFVSLTGTTLQGATATYTTGSFTSLTGTTTSGTTANFVSGVFSTQISGVTVTGTTANFTSGNFTNISGGTHTITSGVFASGTAANPSISFVSDPNTGLYSPGADQVAISTNGTERLFVNSNGDIGVGTNSPANYQVFGYGPTIEALGGRGGSFVTSSSSATVRGVYSADSNAALVNLKTVTNHPLAFGVNDTERMRLDSSGRLGLGTSSAADGCLLTLQESASLGAALALRNRNSTQTWRIAVDATAVDDKKLAFIDGTSSTVRMTVTDAGAVGIGTSSPSGTFTVYDSGNQIVLNAPTSSNSNITFQENGSNKWIAGYVPSISAFRFSNGSSDVLSLTNTGLVGLGASSPSYKLDVRDASVSQIASSVNGAQIAVLGSDTSTGAYTGTLDNYDFKFLRNGAAVGAWTATGLGIGTTSPASLFQVRVAANQNIAFNQLSGESRITCYNDGVSAAASLGLNGLDLRFQTNDVERARIDSSGRLLVGTSSARSNFFNGGDTASIQLEGANGTNRFAAQIYGQANDFGPLQIFAKHRAATVGGTTVVASADELGAISFQGSDGTEFVEGARIAAFVDGTPGANDMPGRLVFSTTADGASGPTEHMRIGNEGDVTLSMTPVAGITNTSGNKLIFKGLQLNGQTNNMASIYGVGGSSWGGDLVFTTKPNDGNPGSSPTERMRITNGGFIKTSDTGTYAGATGLYHELRSSLNDTTVSVTNTNSSFTGVLLAQGSDTAATASYSFQQMYSSYSGTFDVEFNLRGDGTALADGTWTGGGADYAEFFEWSDGNLEEEDRRGISVVLDGEKIRPALAGEDPIGVISGNPSVVGDAAWNKWSGKYLRDAYGTYILEDYEVVNDEGETVVQQRRKLNPAYDPEAEYIPREQRPEWDCVGLMGKLRIRKGQPTGSRWIKMRDISDSVDEWLVR